MVSKKAKVIFFVQGEGNGHLSEAVALYEILTKNKGYNVCAIVIGESNKSIEKLEKLDCNIYKITSFKKQYTSFKNEVSVSKSIYKNILALKSYWKSIKLAHRIISDYNPDLIFNFYEPIFGLYKFFYRRKIKTISVGHQYLYLHPEYKFPDKKSTERIATKLYTRITAFNSDYIWALSSYRMPNIGHHFQVFPPLLREVVISSKCSNEDYFLAYLSQEAYLSNLLNWHKKNNHEVLHIFLDKTQQKIFDSSDKIIFHQFEEKHFIDKLSKCKALFCTAGFDTICESMYFNKPILIFPIKKHFGQNCNIISVGYNTPVFNKENDINKFIDSLSFNNFKSHVFTNWVNSREQYVLSNL